MHTTFRDSPVRRVKSPALVLSVIHKFDYVFAENGTVQYKDGKLVSKHVSEHILHQVTFANSLEGMEVA